MTFLINFEFRLPIILTGKLYTQLSFYITLCSISQVKTFPAVLLLQIENDINKKTY
jgi:hypothetical protein